MHDCARFVKEVFIIKPKMYLFDFAEVITFPQSVETFQRMSALVNLDHAQFAESYWKNRKGYDLGMESNVYWEKVCGQSLDDKLVQSLEALDAESWIRINPVMEKAIADLKRKHKRLALLSNLPMPLVQSFRQNKALVEKFEFLFFSAEIGLVKPDVKIFEFVSEKMKMKPSEILFIDDRLENVEAAKSLGFHTHHFSESGQSEFIKHADDQTFEFHRKSYWVRC